MIENKENGRFRKITQRRIHGIKNHSIWISNRGEIKERSGMKFSKIGRTKTKIKSKVNLITILNYKLMIHDDRLEGKHVF